MKELILAMHCLEFGKCKRFFDMIECSSLGILSLIVACFTHVTVVIHD